MTGPGGGLNHPCHEPLLLQTRNRFQACLTAAAVPAEKVALEIFQAHATLRYLFELVNAERLSDLIVSLLPRVLRQCALASLGQRSRVESPNISIRHGQAAPIDSPASHVRGAQ